MAYVYILKSLVNNRYYIGSTNDIEKRFREHNSGISKYTRLTKPFKIAFVQEYNTIQKARKIELKLKRFKNKKIIDKIVEEKIIKMDS